MDPGYDAYHAPRYAFLIRLLKEFGINKNASILDIGRSELTTRLHEAFGAPVDSLGFGADHTSQSGCSNIFTRPRS